MMVAKTTKLAHLNGAAVDRADIDELALPRTPSDIDRLIGKRLREARKAANLTLMELAELVKIAPQQLQKYEAARTRVSASRLYQLAVVLDRPMFWFFEAN
ncbi:MAG: helix-turn-helix domain-containing protein [Hyphomicrobiaceae bacterium]